LLAVPLICARPLAGPPVHGTRSPVVVAFLGLYGKGSSHQLCAPSGNCLNAPPFLRSSLDSPGPVQTSPSPLIRF
jgi:hypothetical protein